ncbi:MAG TPA: twin-arginine translocation signal domain-containing protein, partial [Candidatus Saccharimonadia bacterium]|nr:twin-arginine translocation signal domain-containing protein [Candidatus Saccharimonadia bacterium]
MMPRRSFLKSTAGAGALAALGELGWLGRLPSVSAAEATPPPHLVQFHPEIEPLVRLLEDTPRERVLEEVASRVQRGLSYREVLAALMLAGVRSVQPRPVGFKFHAVLVVNSAHLASLASPDSDRWLPIFWAIDQFKSSQAANVKEGDWHMGAIDEAAVPSSHHAKKAFILAMDNWDEAAADAAIVGLARTAGMDELFEIFVHYGARDFRDIGHKAIYVANSFRTLEAIGWQHAEPVLRSLAYALLDRSGAKENPAKADLQADRPFRENLPLVKQVREGWLDGKPDADASLELLRATRTGSSSDAGALVLKLLNKGVAPQSLFDAMYNGAGELLMQAPGILSLHAMTFTNAIHYSWQRVQHDETRRLLLLQNAAFLPLYRGNREDKGIHIDTLEPLTPTAQGDEAVAEIFSDIGKDRLMAARKMLGYLKDNPSPKPFADAARRLIFLKGTNSHDYKFSSAVLEDYEHLAPPWRDRL